MKIKNILFSLLACSCLVMLSNCKDDDDDNGSGGGGTSSIYEVACCQIPPLAACVGGARLYLPNAFTPNGDGINDVWFPFGNAGIEIVKSLIVKSSDNTIVFERDNFWVNDPNFGWDGRVTGSISDDVFTYTITVKNLAGESSTFDGGVCIRSTVPLPCVVNEKQCTFGVQHDGAGSFNPGLNNLEDCE